MQDDTVVLMGWTGWKETKSSRIDEKALVFSNSSILGYKCREFFVLTIRASRRTTCYAPQEQLPLSLSIGDLDDKPSGSFEESQSSSMCEHGTEHHASHRQHRGLRNAHLFVGAIDRLPGIWSCIITKDLEKMLRCNPIVHRPMPSAALLRCASR